MGRLQNLTQVKFRAKAKTQKKATTLRQAGRNQSPVSQTPRLQLEQEAPLQAPHPTHSFQGHPLQEDQHTHFHKLF
ncbi:hypothetical protein CsSME_00010270 [Camellia sinensis var. sinensis]